MLKKIVAIAIGGIALAVAYYGSYLPLSKSLAFIDVLRGTDRIHSVKEFEEAFAVPLDIPSPIGQEELVRNLGNSVVNVVQQNKDPQLIEEVINYLDHYYGPIMSGRRGTNFVQNFFVLGSLYDVAFRQTQDARYLALAEEYYRKGLELSPTRPQFLYALFGLYRLEGKLSEAKKIGEQIIVQWPDDGATREALSQFPK